GQPVPWKALSQITLLGCVRYDGSAYRTIPDVFVYPRPIDPNRGSVALEVDGPPVLIIEVLSESTYDVDLDLKRGKGYSYGRAGVGRWSGCAVCWTNERAGRSSHTRSNSPWPPPASVAPMTPQARQVVS